MFYAQDPAFEKTAEGLYLWEPNRNYQVFIRKNVLDSDGIELLDETSWYFNTGTEIDNTPPVISSFNIESLNGSTSYTNSDEVRLSFSAEDESMIPIRAVKYWNLGDSEPATVTLLADEGVLDDDGKIIFHVDDGEGARQVNLKVYDMANNFDEASAVITLDKTGPLITSCTLVDPDAAPHDGDGFSNTRSLSFQLSGTDDNSLDTIGWVIDNPAGSKNWLDYTADPVAISLPDSDGEHTVYFLLKDEAGNLSSTGSDSIVLDRSAPTGSVQVKGGADWICGDDQNAAISIIRSDLSSGLAEVEMAVQVDGDGWSTGDLSSIRAYSSSITDVDLFPDAHIPSHEEEVTVSVKLIDVFGFERTLTRVVRLDFEAPAVSFVIQSLDSLSSGRTDYCKTPGNPYVQLNVSASDTGGSGLAYYRYDTDKSGTDWSGWVSNSSSSVAPRTYLSDRYGNREALVQVMDAAGNISATAADSILNYYHAYFSLYSVYVSDDADSGAGEIYWDFSFQYRAVNGGAVTNYDYIFLRGDGNGVSMTSPATVYISNIAAISGERRSLHWYRSSPPYSLRIVGYLVDDDGASGDDWSDPASYEVTTGASFRTTNTVTVGGAPAGNIRFIGDDNYY